MLYLTYMSMRCKVTLSKQEVKSFYKIKGIKSMVVKAIKTQEMCKLCAQNQSYFDG